MESRAFTLPHMNPSSIQSSSSNGCTVRFHLCEEYCEIYVLVLAELNFVTQQRELPTGGGHSIQGILDLRNHAIRSR